MQLSAKPADGSGMSSVKDDDVVSGAKPVASNVNVAVKQIASADTILVSCVEQFVAE